MGSKSPAGMDLELFQAYASQTAPRLLDQTGVYVVQPNGLQRRLNNVYKLGKGQLQSRFRIYKKMWPDGGKVFAFFTVPTPSAVWAMQRDVPLAREQQLIGVGHGLLRHKRYHGEWIDAPLLEILCAMQQVHKPSEGRFYLCDPSGVRPVFLDDKERGEAPVLVPRRVTPFRDAKLESTRRYFASLMASEKRMYVQQMPRDERQLLWESLSGRERSKYSGLFMSTVVPSVAWFAL